MSVEDIDALFMDHFGVNLADPDLGGVVEPSNEAEGLDDLGAVVRRILPNAPRQAISRIDDAISNRLRTYESYYAGAFAAHAARIAASPNSVMTLYGNNGTAGTTYAANTPVPLFPRLNGVPTTVAFKFAEDMVFHRVVTDSIDCSAGWAIAGNSFKFEDDVISGMLNDCAFTTYRDDVVFERTPLGAYARRTFKAPTALNATAIHMRGAPQELVCGLSVQYRDMRCKLLDKRLHALTDGTSWADTVRKLISARAMRTRTLPRLGGGSALYNPNAIR